MRSKWYFLMVGLALVLGPSLANSQFGPPGGGGGFPGGGGGGRGNRGGGMGGGGMGGFQMDPNQMWDMFAPGKTVLTQADAASNPFAQRMFDRAVQTLGITNGQLTKDQFTNYMQQRMAQRANPGGPTGPGGAPGGPAVAAPGGMTPGGPGGNGWGRGGGNNPWGGGNNPWGGGNNPWGGGWGGGTPGGGNFNPEQIAEMRFRRLDLDGDGLLSADEMNADPTLYAERDRWDTNNDGFIDLNEFKEYFKARVAQFQQNGGFPGGPGGVNPDEKKTTVYRAGKLPPQLPAWFAQYDTDQDGQVGLYEWRKAGQPLEQFEKMDLNGDGFLTVEEVLKAIGATVPNADGTGSPGMVAMGAGGFGRGMGGPGGGGRGNRGMGGGPGGGQWGGGQWGGNNGGGFPGGGFPGGGGGGRGGGRGRGGNGGFPGGNTGMPGGGNGGFPGGNAGPGGGPGGGGRGRGRGGNGGFGG